MSFEESPINMVSSRDIQFSKPTGTGGKHVYIYDIYARYKIFSLKFIRLLRVVFSSQQRLNRLAINAVQ